MSKATEQEATAHLPAYRPTEDHEMPQGRKNWDTPPQQIDGPEGPEPLPHPQDVSGANRKVSRKKPPQQVDGPEGPTPPEPHGNTHDAPVPQQVDGPEGPEATDGTELNTAAEAAALATPPPPGPPTEPEVTAGDGDDSDKADERKSAAVTDGDSGNSHSDGKDTGTGADKVGTTAVKSPPAKRAPHAAPEKAAK